MKTWIVEYEIPPLRAIYHAECDAENEEDVRAEVKAKEPLWRIRKLTLRCSTYAMESGGYLHIDNIVQPIIRSNPDATPNTR